MRFRPVRLGSISLLLVAMLAVLLHPAVGSTRGLGIFESPEFCSHWLARRGDRSLPRFLLRSCLISIAQTYVDGEANFIPPEEMLLADDVIRYQINQAPPERDPGNAEAIRQGIRNGDTAVIADWDNPRWTVDLRTSDVFLIWDGYFVGYPDAPAFFVAERFAIRDGLISEVLIGGVQFAPGCGYGIGCGD